MLPAIAVVDALKKRGITDLNLVTCYATPGGYIALAEQDVRRIGWGGCEYNIDAENGMEDREEGHLFYRRYDQQETDPVHGLRCGAHGAGQEALAISRGGTSSRCSFAINLVL